MSDTSLEVGQVAPVTVTVTSTAEDGTVTNVPLGALTATSADETIVTVTVDAVPGDGSNTGSLTAVSEGIAAVTFSDADPSGVDVTAEVDVTVTAVVVTTPPVLALDVVVGEPS